MLRNEINRKFARDQKSVYRDMNEKHYMPEKIPTKESVENYWKGIWERECSFNRESIWLKELQAKYCQQAQQSEYQVSLDVLDKVTVKLHNRKAPGPDAD